MSMRAYDVPKQADVLEELQSHFPLDLLTRLSQAAIDALQARGLSMLTWRCAVTGCPPLHPAALHVCLCMDIL